MFKWSKICNAKMDKLSNLSYLPRLCFHIKPKFTFGVVLGSQAALDSFWLFQKNQKFSMGISMSKFGLSRIWRYFNVKIG